MSSTETDRPVTLETRDDLEAFVATHDRALVEFHTDGCSMCDAMVPVLGAVARASDVAVATMNPRDDPALVSEYDVRSVPKLLYFADGALADTLADGFVGAERVLSFVGGD